ncbi:MAG: hypothetical protein JW744_02130 [Candidatus Diapherotrites archaeon]|uniref:Uncharacterized protein n=1 Tax=Candidatus Iainarchaeum sp. TaxID=3101447 RepID=A0A938YSG9_9ARCH|nr:hypothetical protein [Candidatus Diapherotrites archaeon]
MTARNSILLIIKQQPGIDYNALLNKIASNYGSIESARAALSRSLRYLNALGMVARRENSLFATAKGAASLNSEMKNKLLLRLNETVKGKNAPHQIDSIVQMLHTLIERSKQDPDLLKAAKGSVGFYVTDLSELSSSVGKRIHSMQYLERVLRQEIDSLKELDFPDFKSLEWSAHTKKSISAVAKKSNSPEFVAECLNEGFMQKAVQALGLRAQQNDLFIEESRLPEFLKFLEGNSQLERNQVNLYLGAIKIIIDYPHVSIIAPCKQLEKLLGKKK